MDAPTPPLHKLYRLYKLDMSRVHQYDEVEQLLDVQDVVTLTGCD